MKNPKASESKKKNIEIEAIDIERYVVRFTERWGTVVVLSFSNAYNSVRMHESMHLVDCYWTIMQY